MLRRVAARQMAGSVEQFDSLRRRILDGREERDTAVGVIVEQPPALEGQADPTQSHAGIVNLAAAVEPLFAPGATEVEPRLGAMWNVSRAARHAVGLPYTALVPLRCYQPEPAASIFVITPDGEQPPVLLSAFLEELDRVPLGTERHPAHDPCHWDRRSASSCVRGFGGWDIGPRSSQEVDDGTPRVRSGHATMMRGSGLNCKRFRPLRGGTTPRVN